MKQFSMNDRKEKPDEQLNQKSLSTDAAFDKWLTRGLHELFDDVMKEPVPPELLRILQSQKYEDDKKK